MKRYIAIALALLVVAGAWWAIEARKQGGEMACGLEFCAPSGRLMSIENYVRMNISELSPIKETLGGTFYVTEVEAHGGAGTVRYEDGHTAYTADFTYSIDEKAGIAVDSFTVRK